ncbi:MAG: lysophospholipase [Reichenbachiella sp.]
MNKVLLAFFTIILLTSIFHPAFSIRPDKEYILTPDSVGWSYEELVIKTEDNLDLNTWIYSPNPETDKKTVLVLAYPDAGNMSYFVYHAAFFANSGFTVVTFDYRGFGKSSDFIINPNYLYYNEFSQDLISVIKNISSKYKNHSIGIWALSMGTAVTVNSYNRIADEIDFIIGEGFVTNPKAFVERAKTQKDKNLLLPENAETYITSLNKITIPILLFSGSNDKFTTTQDTVDLKSKLGNTCQIIEYQGGHISGFQAWTEKGFGAGYLEKIDQFLN